MIRIQISDGAHRDLNEGFSSTRRNIRGSGTVPPKALSSFTSMFVSRNGVTGATGSRDLWCPTEDVGAPSGGIP
jgi:hypothetical protein